MPRTAPSPAASAPSAPPHGLLGWFERRWVSIARSSPRDEQQTAYSSQTAGPTHLIILVNGLFGSASNWDVMCEQLRQHLPPDTLLHPSTVNARCVGCGLETFPTSICRRQASASTGSSHLPTQPNNPTQTIHHHHPNTTHRFATYQGIDTCGQRLADEIRTVAAAHPSLTRLSVVAHSMGGLMARYALGSLFNPGQGRVCGLEPAHFVSMATPHCGCDADGVAQVCLCGVRGGCGCGFGSTASERVG
jgi:hypothetical protein